MAVRSTTRVSTRERSQHVKLFVEVQSGSYLGDDGIVRLEDTYGRVR